MVQDQSEPSAPALAAANLSGGVRFSFLDQRAIFLLQGIRSSQKLLEGILVRNWLVERINVSGGSRDQPVQEEDRYNSEFNPYRQEQS